MIPRVKDVYSLVAQQEREDQILSLLWQVEQTTTWILGTLDLGRIDWQLISHLLRDRVHHKEVKRNFIFEVVETRHHFVSSNMIREQRIEYVIPVSSGTI